MRPNYKVNHCDSLNMAGRAKRALTETLLNLSDWNLSTFLICFLAILVLRRGLAAIVINNNDREPFF